MSHPEYNTLLLRAGTLALDGGSMFGIIPRVVWEKAIAPDPRGRIRVAHNALLLSRVDDPTQRILIEAGSGDKFDVKNRDIFGLSDESIHTELSRRSIDPTSIQHAIVTHMHFDHCGGLTRLNAAGQSVSAFPNATIHVQRREWTDALANNSVMTRTYLRENLEPIRDQLRLVDSPQPFTRSELPSRLQVPTKPLEDRMTEILPGIFTFIVPGHTWGQQAILFQDSNGQPIAFVPDVLPTAHHVGAAYNLAYDVEPFVSMLTRRWLLHEAVDRNWKLVLVHDPGCAIYRVRENDKQWFDLVPDALNNAS